MSQVVQEEIRVMKSLGEIRGKANKFFNHLMKITITRESNDDFDAFNILEEEQEEAEELPRVNEYEEEA